ncbi:hypothetical protein Taro_030955 [Colocasia esculenta]|uniref:Uncharacterized protein n=1 Tax=Colocasia esculenta TaxID=4460 RepID=A0A843VNS6_COLES|nr:hypothetical protein [Colocasia esculenta]
MDTSRRTDPQLVPTCRVLGLQRRCDRLVPPAVELVMLCELVLPRGMPQAMAGRTRRSSVPIQDEEPRGTTSEQQRVPAAQGPPAPPPPPLVDYGTFMQGLVQVMQT